MKHVHSTWYLLVDGTHADPNDVAPGDDGVLRHKSGLAVALRADGVPQSIGVDAKANKNVEAAEAGEEAAAEAKAQLAADVKAARAEAENESVATEIDPATGKPADAPAESYVDDASAAKDLKPATPRKYKTREVKGR